MNAKNDPVNESSEAAAPVAMQSPSESPQILRIVEAEPPTKQKPVRRRAAPVAKNVHSRNSVSRKPLSQRRSRAELYFNRELSWLDFNARVLSEAASETNPLLERIKFLAIFANNLDEFFMIHVPGMMQRSVDEAALPLFDKTVSTIAEIHSRLRPMLELQFRCFQELIPQIARFGVHLIRYQDLSDNQKDDMRRYFEAEVFPVLTPLAVDPGHPFPYISNLSLSLAVVVHDPRTGKDRFARVKVPARAVLPRLVRVGPGWQYTLLEELITAHIGSLFAGMEVRACYPFRITRDADLELQEESADDLLEMIEEELSKRRFGNVVRIELARAMPEDVRQRIMDELEATEEQVYTVDGPLNMSDLFSLAAIDIPELRDPPFAAGIPKPLRGQPDTFAAIRKCDILLHHPYQAFSCVSDLLSHAAQDPQVLTIKHTLYRTTGDSPILKALTDAADNGKQVACVVELKARFDEANNISWARQLEKSGVHVVYGLLGLKTHCKVTLIVRREGDKLRRYVHVGTGNYNPRTAAIYTDIGLLTCSQEFGADATDLFNYLTGYAHQEQYRKFLVSPGTARKRLMQMVDREAAKHTPENPGRIVAKMNALVDPPLIKALYAASRKGVQVDLIIRGMCCLRPGVPGLSENIRVVSIVGRFLEHSRIFYFRNGGPNTQEVYFGSADWMPRNLDRRIEVIVPVEDLAIRQILLTDVLEELLKDNCQAWDLYPDGKYIRRHPAENEAPYNVQKLMLAKYAR
jgi:polyphosphate kinase